MATITATFTFDIPASPNMPGDTPEVNAVACFVKQGEATITSDSRIPPVSPAVFTFPDLPEGVYEVTAFLADAAWQPVGEVLAQTHNALNPVIRPVPVSLTVE